MITEIDSVYSEILMAVQMKSMHTKIIYRQWIIYKLQISYYIISIILFHLSEI
jgi:hypothetical protein